ncbi:hypothetical protein [Gluconobacter cerinus]|uniref:hypothetical protein n=1 Tax=Gluconobacter cerinus TaxID=38307 RepID=UPI003AB2E268
MNLFPQDERFFWWLIFSLLNLKESERASSVIGAFSLAPPKQSRVFMKILSEKELILLFREARIKTRGQELPTFLELQYEALQPSLTGSPDWRSVTAGFSRLGIRNARNGPLMPDTVRKAWRRVELKAKAEARLERAVSPSVHFLQDTAAPSTPSTARPVPKVDEHTGFDDQRPNEDPPSRNWTVEEKLKEAMQQLRRSETPMPKPISANQRSKDNRN